MRPSMIFRRYIVWFRGLDLRGLRNRIRRGLCIVMADADVFRALADPTRRAMFERLGDREMTVSALKAGSDVSQPAISQHLAALRGAGLVRERREGRFAYYRVDPAGLTGLAAWVDRHRALWPRRIERLKVVLEGMEP